MTEGTTGLDLEVTAAQRALSAAEIAAKDIQLIISASFPALPEPCIGNSAHLASSLGAVDAATYNIECACAGGLVALRAAQLELVNDPALEHVLVTASCSYSRTITPLHPARDHVADGAFASVVSSATPNEGIIASSLVNSSPTGPLLSWRVSSATPSGIILDVHQNTAMLIQSWTLGRIPKLWDVVLERAGLARTAIDHWVVNAPTASFVREVITALGGDPEGMINTYPRLGNIGPVLFGAALYYTAVERRPMPGDLVACCSVGSKASLALAIMRWPSSLVAHSTSSFDDPAPTL